MSTGKIFYYPALVLIISVSLILIGKKVNSGDLEAQGFYTTSVPSSLLNDFRISIQNLIEQDEMVGIEVLIMQEDEVLLHEGFGLLDKEKSIPMGTGSLFNIRSMTKPMGGTIAQIMLDRGLIELDDKVSEYLPSFDNPKSKNITIEALLTHRSGFEQGQPGKSWTRYNNVREMADYWGTQGPTTSTDHWSYADANADIFAAITEEVLQKNASTTLQKELIIPLGLKETITLSNSFDPVYKEIAPTYRGQKGDWQKRWSPESGTTFYDFTMFAQSVFSSSIDYANFMKLWMNKGLHDGKQIFSTEAFTRTFSNREKILVPPGLFPLVEGMNLHYGHMWAYAFKDSQSSTSIPYVFFHQGSDGTGAYAFPEEKIIAVFMTQSRGTQALPLIENDLRKFIEGI